jgi:hypothetical protein
MELSRVQAACQIAKAHPERVEALADGLLPGFG